MSSNLNAILGYSLQVVNVAATTTPINIQWQGQTYAATATFTDNYFQATAGGSAIPLPTGTYYVFYVKNLDASNNVTLAFTTSGGSNSVLIGPGGVFLYFMLTAAGGITGGTLTGNTATVSCEVMVGS